MQNNHSASGGVAQFTDLRDAHVFITGGGSGIGAALTEGFLQQGACVSFVDIADSTAFCDEMEKKYQRRPFFRHCDIRDVQALSAAISATEVAQDRIGILINNAARDDRHSIEATSPEQWDDLMAINLRSQFFAVQSVLPGMKAMGKGAIINVSSNSYMLGLGGYPAYVSAKAAIAGLTKSLARDLGPFGIRVNCLVPGWVMTERQKNLWANEKAVAECLAQQSLKHVIEPEDMIAPCLFLSSTASRMMTGQLLVVDGGRV